MGFLSILTFLVFVFFSVVLVVAVLFSEEIKSAKEKDPSSKGYLEIIILYPGLHAIIFYRMAHALWKVRLTFLARALSQFARFLTGIEIHPGAKIGKGFFIDHGMGVVIGETSIIGDNVTLFQGVTLGGTGKETGKRHPTLGNNIVVGTGAKILGNIKIGSNSYVGANAVVIRDVPEHATIVGVPGHIAKHEGKRVDLLMDHVHISDPVMQHMRDLLSRVKALEDRDKQSIG
ncbi:MAG TPA: serine O-acetyltransferase [Candidatus Omnitrophota bacterium]|nr:serine O-acetyltransferase [Candidatus Omnitrophota bacterium]